MKARLWVLVLVFCCFCYSNSFADTTTTNPTELDLSDGTITNPYGGCPAGTTAAQVNTSNWGTETVRFGECVNTFAISMAINQALTQSGISVDKVHYRWKYIMCFNTPNDFCSNNISNRVNTTTGEVTDDTYFDQLAVTVEVTDASGNVVKTETWTMDKWYDWNNANAHSTNEINESGVRWQIHEDNIELYNHLDKIGTIYTPNQLGDVRFRVVGNDGGNWDGYYGPVVRDIESWFTYRANPCNDTALYDPSCPGYSEAYAQYEYDQNCAANALYDSGCPGYAQAFYNAQCNADPLYDSGCPGYATAYYNQQCSADPLYDSGCDGYEQAYLTQQCNLDSHYSSSCPNYNWANTDYTTDLENKSNNNDFIEIVKADNSDVYWALFYNESELDSGEWIAKCKTYDNGCEDAVITGATFNGGPNPYVFLYTTDKDGNVFYPTNGHKYRFMTDTKLDTLCDSNTLYSPMCDGYEEAYATYIFNEACTANPLYNSECPGYDAAYLTYQCEQNPLYDSSCSGYAAAYLTYQCEQNPLYDESCTGYAAAYLSAQCELNPLYDESCTGYDAAYLTQQCSLNPLYDESCTGYFDAKCEADPLYNVLCTGYDKAYFDQQCQYNPQYDELCTGYVAPVVETNPEDIVDDGTGTGDAVVDSVIEAPEVTVPGEIPGVEIEVQPAPEVEIVVVAVEPEVIDVPVPDIAEQIEAEVEMELQMEIEAEMELNAEVPEMTDDIEEAQTETNEDTVEENIESESTENETTEETTEENTVEEETVEEESVEEETIEEESTEEESTEEESTEEESTEEESTDEADEKEESEESEEKESEEKEESENEEVVAKKETKNKKVKKLSAKEKAAAKKKKMKKIIKDKLKKLAVLMGEAQSLQEQQALQQLIAALINYVPGFNEYGKYNIPGINFYQPEAIYEDKKIPENQRGLLNGLASELKHKKMVDMQYEGME